MNEMEIKQLPLADELKIDKIKYYNQKIQGYYNFNCRVSDALVRTAKFYIPKDSRFNQPTIFILVPEETNTYQFLVDSCWMELADREKINIVLLEPDPSNKWGKFDTEVKYIYSMVEDVSLRPFFCAYAPSFYAIAYGESADLLGYYSRRYPKSWAGIGLIGTSGVDDNEIEALSKLPSAVPHIMLNEVQMPIWIAASDESKDISNLLKYYKKANKIVRKRIEDGKTVYISGDGGSIDEHWCSKVVFDRVEWKDTLSYKYIYGIFSKLFYGKYRYPGNNNGALRSVKSIYERGFEKYSAMVNGGFKNDDSDKYYREWWIYRPKYISNKELTPLVFVFHGAGGSGDEIADRSGWAYVAEKYGFTILMPTASLPNRIRKVSDIVTNEMFRPMWNTGAPTEDRPSDLKFIDFLYNWVLENYNIDKDRVYASGQSSGGMMSWACALYRPDYFAAVAPISAKDVNLESEKLPPVRESIVPAIAFLGLEDRVFSNGFATENAKKLINYWKDSCNLTEGWDSYTYADGGKNASFKEGYFTNYIYRNRKSIPLLRCIEVDTKAHAVWPSECEIAWNEWFNFFSKDYNTKDLYYKGNLVIC